MAMHVVNIARAIRNRDNTLTWDSLEPLLEAAKEHCLDMALVEEHKVLNTTILRGQTMLRTSRDPRQVLLVFSLLMPNTRGVDQTQLLRDQKSLSRVRKAGGYPVGSVSAAGGFSPPITGGGHYGGHAHTVYTPPVRSVAAGGGGDGSAAAHAPAART